MNARQRQQQLAARRRFLQAAGAAGLALSPLGRVLADAGVARAAGELARGYGPLKTVRDGTTGLPLLRLPAGFSYLTFGWAGETMSDGAPCPGAHDGMGIVRERGNLITLVRNHEIARLEGAFGAAASQYDPVCSGGTVSMEFDLAAGELKSLRPSLSGTMQNCAGGVTPWHSWLSCEEYVSPAGRSLRGADGQLRTMQLAHGFVFEVPADGESNARPLPALGQFRHEAATVFVPGGELYLTEDAEPSAGFFRFVPSQPGRLEAGGQLSMLRVKNMPDLRSGLQVGQRWSVDWVPIERPDQGIDRRGGILGVQQQGLAQGASMFTRLEGCIANDEEVFFTATNGGDVASGQLFCYYPKQSELQLIYESTDAAVLDYPDNVCLSPRGGLVIAEDSKQRRQHLYGLTRAGELFRFAQQSVVLDGAKGFSGDFRSAEWAGCCFSADGRWLFANIYTPGFSVAITGPWGEGLL